MSAPRPAVRIAGAAILAAVVTTGLLYAMQALVSEDRGPIEDRVRRLRVDILRPRRETRVETTKRVLPEREPQRDRPPPTPSLPPAPATRLSPTARAVELPALDFRPALTGGPSLGAAPAADGEAIPLVRIQPRYPTRAATRGIEGWVLVEFTIDSTGAVADPEIVESHPSSIFNREALRAIRKWKYKPRIEAGVPVARPGIRVKLRFELED